MSENSNNRNSYGNIFKAIGLFGGVKMFQILVGLIKNKFVAVLLGPFGMGISGMITSNTSLIKTLTGFGLETSSVRDIANSYESENQERIGRTAAILRKLVVFTGILGVAVTFALAKELSIWSFGNEDYSNAFRWVSITLFLDQLVVGQTAIMQGTFHYKYMARATLWGSIVGLFVSVPLYYIWGVDAIVPVIIISSLVHLLLSWIYCNKVHILKTKVSLKDILTDGRTMMVLGIAVALTSACTIGKTYLVRVFISGVGSLDDVGLYTAGITIATQYINVILNAMGTDYTPRLAAIADNKEEFEKTINKQMHLMLTIMVPVIVVFIAFIKELIILLYSSKFIAIIGMIEWMMLGMLFKSVSWCISFSFVAKGDAQVFLWNSLLTAVYSLIFTVLGYKWYSFTGVGMAFCLTYIVYSLHMYLLAKSRYDYSLPLLFVKKIFIQALFISAVFVILKMLGYSWQRYVVGSLLVVFTMMLTYRNLSELLPLKQYLNKLLKK